MNDILANKLQNLQRCIVRAREEYSKSPETFATDYSHQDAAILNVLRACETLIDLSNHCIKRNKLGIPTSSAQSFELLKQGNIIAPSLADAMKRMVHFRNTIVHQYDDLDVAVVEDVILHHLDSLLECAEIIIKHMDM